MHTVSLRCESYTNESFNLKRNKSIILNITGGLLSSLPAMHLQGRVLRKSGPAVGALVGPRARVRPFMQQQGRFGAEGLPAVGTHVLQVPLVHLGAKPAVSVTAFTSGRGKRRRPTPVSGGG